jgi:hypothetical protein
VHLHVVAFNVPHPANYGGVIAVYYKLRALAEAGVRLHLHCFQYGRAESPDLAAFCERVYYYPRRSTLRSLPIRKPYIVGSRRSEELRRRLASDEHPILFEGLHTCGDLPHPSLRDRSKFVRAHNVEWSYYRQLSASQRHRWMGLLMRHESRLLKTCESVFSHADAVFAISPSDYRYYRERFDDVEYLPAFHRHSDITSKTGRGAYCIYHANLGVADNHRAALFLVNEVFSHMAIPFIVAGMDPQPDLIAAVAPHSHMSVRANLPEAEMLRLIQEAHIHVMPTFQVSGLKLKLLNALFSGRHCVVSPEMVHDTGLAGACDVARGASAFRGAIRRRFSEPFSRMEIDRRRHVLFPAYDNALSARKLTSRIFARSDARSVPCG